MKFIDDSMQMDDKSVFSHRVFTIITVIAAAAAAVMEVVSFVLWLVVPDVGLMAYCMLFYPTAICLAVVFFYTIPELLRNVYLSSVLMLSAAAVMTLLLIASIFMQVFMLGTVHIVPFNFF